MEIEKLKATLSAHNEEKSKEDLQNKQQIQTLQNELKLIQSESHLQMEGYISQIKELTKENNLLQNFLKIQRKNIFNSPLKNWKKR